MLAFKRFVTIVVMVYLLLALLFLLVPAVRETVAGIDTTLGSLNPLNALKERDFYRALAWSGVLILGLHLVVENLDSSLLRRTVTQNENKINELKARLYDNHQQRDPSLPARPTYADDDLNRTLPPTDQVV
jgi:hypothetical protein